MLSIDNAVEAAPEKRAMLLDPYEGLGLLGVRLKPGY
mgnify:FL=1